MITKEILNRRSTRKYQNKEVSEEYITAIIKAGQFAPTSRNNRAIEFIVVKNQETKKTIFDIVGQEFVKEAPILIVPTTDVTKTNSPLQDLSVASQNIFLQAEALGLGSVWKNLKTDSDVEEKIKKLLNIPQEFKVINIIPIGYPQEKPMPYSDEDFETNKIHQEKW